jgi:predicted permease
VLSDLLYRLRALFRPKSMEAELDAELRAHLEHQVEKYVQSGLAVEEARRRARLEFGGLDQVKEECRDARGLNLTDSLLQDLRYGWRMLVKNPMYTAASAIALAIGIAANTVIFTAYNAVDLRSIQGVDPGRLVNIYRWEVGTNGQTFSYPSYIYFRDHNTTFSSLVTATGTDLSFSEVSRVPGSSRGAGKASSLFGIRFFQQMAGGAELVSAAVVSENYFQTLGISPVLGRAFVPDDARRQDPVVMASYEFWKRRLNSSPAVLGKLVKLNGKSLTVVGVTPRDFMGTYPDIPSVWVPVSSLPLLEPKNDMQRDCENDCCGLYGRLKPGATREQAQSELTVLAEQFRKTLPAGSKHSKPVSITVTPGSPFSFGDRSPVRLIALILMAATGLVLVIACANVAGLQLARSAARQKEFGVRLAMGAGRKRLIRQLLTEATMLAVLSGTLGLLLAWWTLRNALAIVSTALPPVWGTIALHVDPDIHVFAYTLLVCLGAGVLFGLAPALEASKPNLNSVLKEEGTAFGLRLTKSRLRDILIASQMAISLVLLIAAGLLARGSFQAVKINPGFETKKVLGIDVEIPPGAGYDARREGLIVSELRERFSGIPGVRSVARGRVPLGGGIRTATVSLVGKLGKSAPVLSYSYVSQNYFDALDIPIVRGRSFTQDEARSGALVTLVSEAAARRLWPHKDPLGKLVTLDATEEFHWSDQPFPAGQSFRVIGVTPDLSSNWLGRVDDGYFYLPLAPAQWYDTMLIRAEGNPEALIAALGDQASKVDANVIVFGETIDGLMTNNPPFVFSRIAAVLSVVIGLLGLILASVGIYGMVSFVVVQRTHEVGVRMALGARRRDVLILLLRQSMQPVAVGMLIGFTAAAATSRLLSSLLFGISPIDPLAFLGVSAVLASVAFLASYIPARRATGVDPMAALRYE